VTEAWALGGCVGVVVCGVTEDASCGGLCVLPQASATVAALVASAPPTRGVLRRLARARREFRPLYPPTAVFVSKDVATRPSATSELCVFGRQRLDRNGCSRARRF
jgi:hypothetical protein